MESKQEGPTPDAGDDAEFAAQLSGALEDANLPSVLAALVQITGERSYLDKFTPGPMRGTGDHDDAGLSSAQQQSLRETALDVTLRHRGGEFADVSAISPSDVVDILRIVVGDDVPANEAGLLSEELGLSHRDPEPLSQQDISFAPEVLIIGAGFSGLAAAVRFSSAGLRYTIVEKNDSVGGTWAENVYPGAGVDTPVHLYSFSFAQRPDWPRYFARQPEVAQYLRDVAKSHGLEDAVEFGTEVVSALWDDAHDTWLVDLRKSDGTVQRREFGFIVSAVGQFNRAAWPDLPGLESFSGPVVHTAEWDPGIELAGKRIAVVGSGASAMQLVPDIHEAAAQTYIFQRSPQWILPNPNTSKLVTEQKQFLMAHMPWYLGWYRIRHAWNFGDRMHPILRVDSSWEHQDRSINAQNERHRQFLTRYMGEKLKSRPDLLAMSLPTYPPYGKRPLLDHGWFEALQSDNVKLVAEKVVSVEPGAVVTESGARYEVEVIVMATGFQTLNLLSPIEIRGKSGATLRECWGADDAKAMLGMTVPDFPNFAMLFGPNTNAGHGGSLVMTVEMQVRYLIQMLSWIAKDRLHSVEVREDVFTSFIEELDAALDGSVWAHRGMTTYYRNSAGRIVGTLPWTNAEYWDRTISLNRNDYITT